MQRLDTEILAQLVSAKRACLVRLRDMGRKQFELIQGGQMTALLDLLAAKQSPLMELQRIEKALDPYRPQDPERRRWPKPADRATCAREQAECEALLREIVQQEKRSEAVLTERRDETSRQLQGMHRATQARGAYAASSQAATRRIDLLCEG